MTQALTPNPQQSQAATPASIEVKPYSLPGSKTLLMGDSGAGKTDALVTLVEAGITPFIIFTEPGMTSVAKACTRRGIDMTKIHWCYLAQSNVKWKAMEDMLDNVNKLSFEGLTKVSDGNKSQHRQMITLMKICNNFVCERTGKSFGDVGLWNTDRALCIDSLSGINEISMSLTVGGKPTRAPGEWMVAQNNIRFFLKKILTDLRCHVAMTGHLAREKDEVSGEIQVMVSTLGKALAPDIPKDFDDVILAVRNGAAFRWSTARPGVVTKNRHAPLSDQIDPTFVGLIKQWKENGGIISPTEVKS